MTPKRETMKQAGYIHHAYRPGEGHVLRDASTGNLELWVANKGHASYGIIYKNTDLEFVRGFR